MKSQLALACLILAKVVGIAGLVLSYTELRTLGAALLVLDGVLLLTAVILAIWNGKEMAQESETEKDLLERMLREGTLKQHLKDLGYR